MAISIILKNFKELGFEADGYIIIMAWLVSGFVASYGQSELGTSSIYDMATHPVFLLSIIMFGPPEYPLSLQLKSVIA